MATLARPPKGSEPSIGAAPPKYATKRTIPSSHPLATLAFATLRAAFASLPEVCGSSMCAIFAERSNYFTWSSTRNMKPPRSFLNKGTSSSTTMPSISEAHEIAHVASAAATNLPSSHMVFVSTEFLSKHKKMDDHRTVKQGDTRSEHCPQCGQVPRGCQSGAFGKPPDPSRLQRSPRMLLRPEGARVRVLSNRSAVIRRTRCRAQYDPTSQGRRIPERCELQALPWHRPQPCRAISRAH